ncbi:MAG: hypothetical protein ACFB5Z_09365 [Elainellaceae cyanobacterium]
MMHNNEAELLEHLLRYYSFEVDHLTVEQCVAQWRDRYPSNWLRAAVVEALYQGRYKAISVSQILDMWQRRGQSLCHYNGEFERMICNKFLTHSFSEVVEVSRDSAPVERPEPESAVQATADGDRPFPRPEAASPEQQSPEPPPHTAPSAGFDATEPRVSLLEDEFLEVFAAEGAENPHGIAPFKPNAEVSAATSRFSQVIDPWDEPPASMAEPSTAGASTHAAVDSTTPEPKSAAESSPERLSTGGAAIHEFIPTPASSDLYSRLKAALNRVVSATPSVSSTSKVAPTEER